MEQHKCQEFTNIIGDCLQDDTLDEIRASRFVTVSLDGSTDSSVQEKEMIYVTFINADGHPKCKFFVLPDVSDATSIGIQTLLMERYAELDMRNRLVSICVDGAAVNLSVRHGLSALLKEDMPWLVAVHCMNHQLELAAKDACSTSFLDEISTVLLNLHYMYEKSPKRLRELQMLAELMEESIRKPDKAKVAPAHLLLGYPVIVAHLKSTSSDESNLKLVDKIRFSGNSRN